MKPCKILSVPAIVAIFLMVNSCTGKSGNTTQSQNAETASVEISIKGMTCTGCEQTIQSGIMKLEGIESVKATFTDGRAIVVFDPAKTDTLEMKEAVLSKGYTVNKFTTLQPEGVTN